jgi:transketolase
MAQKTDLDQLCVNTIRFLSVDAVQKANSGHPGLPMGTASMAYVLWTRFLRFDPTDPGWPDRDRFILSAGHGSMLLYSLLHLTGYDLPLEQLKNFRQWGSLTPGHPESGLTPGVEVTTGPLGQGFANGVGMAMAECYLGGLFNAPNHRILDHYTYAIVSDGDLMEGISAEAASIAGHLGLGKLIYLYDDNHISIEGSTDLTFTEDRGKRFEAQDWHVQHVEDGNDLDAIEQAIRAAQDEKVRPSIICVRNHIGFGSPNKQDDASAHGAPLGEDEVALTKEALGWPEEPEFYIPEEALARFRQAGERGGKLNRAWRERFQEYAAEHEDAATLFRTVMEGDVPPGWDRDMPRFSPDDGPMATRSASGKVINGIASDLLNMIGGSADLAPSNNTFINDYDVFEPGRKCGRNIHFGVREHAMGGIVNGLSKHGGIIPYGGTFLIFSDYMRGAIRVGALQKAPAIWVFTHDSVGVGEDGPTHQPVENLMALRAIPNLVVLRPADATETAEAWRAAIDSCTRGTPVALALTRQKLPVLAAEGTAAGVCRGAYVVSEAPDGPDGIDALIIATGSEVHLGIEAQALLQEKGVSTRVVSMPSWELFEQQEREYRDSVILPSVRARVTVEAGVTLGWCRYAGDGGVSIGIDRFGASAPGPVVMERLGITTDNVVESVLGILPR